MSRRIREARKSSSRPTVVIQVPQRLDRQTLDTLGRIARCSMPGRRVLVVDAGTTVTTA